MAGSQIERAFLLIEALAKAPEGLAIQTLAQTFDIPKSAVHRMLSELVRLGIVRQDVQSLHYKLTSKLLAMGFQYLAGSGVNIVQPVLDRLAETSGELVRLGIIENPKQTWIAKSQGARSGLKYDPDMGRTAPLGYTASGHAWLCCLTEQEALELLGNEPMPDFTTLGPNAPRDTQAILNALAEARRLGYAYVAESSAVGMSALACAIRHPVTHAVIGVLSIAGPSARLPKERVEVLAKPLCEAAAELSALSTHAELFVLD